MFQIFQQEAKIIDRSIVIQFIAIKTPLFDHWCDMSRLEAEWNVVRCKRSIEQISKRRKNRI